MGQLLRMKSSQIRWAFAFALMVGADMPHAQVAPSTPAVRTGERAKPDAQIDDARRALEQAAAQADFASDEREVALLQRAHDDLSAAIHQLQGARRQRALDLLSDLDQAMQRTAAQVGRFVSPGEKSVELLVPSRQLLNSLATEALELQRNTPQLQRLPDTVVIDAGQPRRPGATTAAPARNQIEPADRELLSWPLGFQEAWPEIAIPF